MHRPVSSGTTDLAGMAVAELYDPVVGLSKLLLGSSVNDSKKVRGPKTGTWKNKNSLLLEKQLRELLVVRDVHKGLRVHAHHHVHGSSRLHERQAPSLRQHVYRALGAALKGCDIGSIEFDQGILLVGQDLFECGLYKRIGAEDKLGQIHESLPGVRQDPVAVMDAQPPDAPAWHEEHLGHASHGDHWNCARQRGNGRKRLAREHHFTVDFVGDDWDPFLLSNAEDAFQCLLGKDRATGVRWVVHQDGLGVLRHQSFHRLYVRLPILFGQQWILDNGCAIAFSDDLVQGKPRPRD
mmetsp:Transcript_32813/g.94877  ORF Transcript_32813/g.94877 Transcript_32813/m.94877 type:complete len:295 (-) Transcript_32813:437-1321(-)